MAARAEQSNGSLGGSWWSTGGQRKSFENLRRVAVRGETIEDRTQESAYFDVALLGPQARHAQSGAQLEPGRLLAEGKVDRFAKQLFGARQRLRSGASTCRDSLAFGQL
jgi:hypothetical protein